jgi:hypothetical protein
MDIDNALDLRSEIFRDVFRYKEIPRLGGAGEDAEPLWMDPVALEAVARGVPYQSPLMGIAMGFKPPVGRRPNHRQVRLSVLLQDRKLLNSVYVANIKEKVRRSEAEVDVRFIGRVRQAAGNPGAGPARVRGPVGIGSSIGHIRGLTGTAACFVRTRTENQIHLLSNQHVLARNLRPQAGDLIISPGRTDGGDQSSQVGALSQWHDIELGPAGTNTADCAIAALFPQVSKNYCDIPGLGTLRGLRTDPLTADMAVAKYGRTSGLRHGRVVDINVVNLTVAMAQQGAGRVARFDNQISISGVDGSAFAKPGDSGSLVVDEDLDAVALLFAVSSGSGTGLPGLAFANRMSAVLDLLDVDIHLGGQASAGVTSR